MRMMICGMLMLLVAAGATAQTPDPPLDETRLSVHTLVREDVFSGWRTGNKERLERAEKNIQQLLKDRPGARADLLAWQGSIDLYRAVEAHEQQDSAAFQKHYQRSQERFAEARRLSPEGEGVAAIVGGSHSMFADRLPENVRPPAWDQAYKSYRTLWEKQSAVLDRLPEHMRGELLGGLALTALRTGRDDEVTTYVDKMIELLPDSAYARAAEKWKQDPDPALASRFTCRTCHAPGRLSARLAELNE